MQPETRFARLGDDRIAYQVMGEGPPDLMFLAGFGSHVDLRWEQSAYVTFMQRLASFSRLIMFDRRGSGVSDPVPLDALPTWEEWAADQCTVMDVVGSKQAAIFAHVDAGSQAMFFAATYPERTSALVLFNVGARYVVTPDHPWGLTPEAGEAVVAMIKELWGTEALAELAHPSRAHDPEFRSWFARYMRSTCSPREYAAYSRQQLELDARHILPAISAPTLIMQRRGYAYLDPREGRYMAEQIPRARFVELPGTDSGAYTENADEIADLIEEFVTGVRHAPSIDRVLATVMFTDIVGSTELAARLGDRMWRQRLTEHDDTAREHVLRHRGKVVRSTGDGVMATFDGPGRGIRCAMELGDALRTRGLDVRAGLHTGEVELANGDIRGLSVHIGARVMEAAGPGEILVSRTVRDLVIGGGVVLEERGGRALKGVPGQWELFAVARA